MDIFKMKLSDIFKYMVSGLVEVMIIVAIIGLDKVTTAITGILQYGQVEELRAIIMTAIPIVVLASLYILGYLTQSILLLFYGGRFLGTGICEVAQYIRHYPKLMPKEDKYPDWVHWSDNPGKVIDTYKEILEAQNPSDYKTEFLYSNQMFQGISFALVIVLLYSCTTCDVLQLALPAAFLLSLFIINKCARKWPILPYIFTVIICIALAIRCFYMPEDNQVRQWIWLLFLVISLIFAIQLAKRQIIRFGVLTQNTNDGIFRKTLERCGQPKAYILIRAHQVLYLKDTLNSIVAQDYPNIKVLLLIDNSAVSTERDSIIALSDSFREQHKLNIVTSISKKSGPAAMAYEIRDIYLKYANADDIAIMLDSDDKFYAPTVISRIMTKMFRTKSDICLISFEIFGHTSLNFSMNTHNKLVKEIATEKPFWTTEELDDKKKIHRISTIGWTKCYTKEIVSFYQECLKEYYNVNYNGATKFEDFPDIVTLLKKDIRICAVEKTSILFRKRTGSTTTDIKWKNYEDIRYFLQTCSKIVDSMKEYLIENAAEIATNRLIPFKFLQYYNILATDESVRNALKTEDAANTTPENKFYKLFVEDSIKKALHSYQSSDVVEGDFKILGIDAEKYITNIVK